MRKMVFRGVVRFAVLAAIAAILVYHQGDNRPIKPASERSGSVSIETEQRLRPVQSDLQPPTSDPSDVPVVFPQFAAWAEEFIAARASGNTAILQTKELAIARQRRRVMEDLIKRKPKLALEWAVTRSIRAQLPPEITEDLETHVSGRGFYGVMIMDDLENGRHEVRREVVLQGKRYDAYVYGQRVNQSTRSNMALYGIALGQALAVHESSVRLLQPEEIPADAVNQACPVSARAAGTYGTPVYADVAGQIESFCGPYHAGLLDKQLAAEGAGGEGSSEATTAQDSWSQGTKTCLFMRVAFPDDPAEPITEDGAYAVMDGVNQWFVENSYQTTAIIPTVTRLLMLPQRKEWYGVQGTGRLLADAREMARRSGYESDNYHFDVVRHIPVPGFNFNGLGYVRGKGVWLQSSSVGLACHELGHNYGLWHANSWNASGDSVIGPGYHVEYGNSFDTMGAANAGIYQFNVFSKNLLDWLPDSFVQSAPTSGVYRLYTYDVPGLIAGQKYALKMRKDYDRNYWGEFRQQFGHRWLLNGIILNWDPWNNGVADSAGGTHLLDTTPGTPDGKNDCPVVIGRTFSDAGAGLHLTPVARGDGGSGNWIDVVVNMGEFPGNEMPAVRLVADRTRVEPEADVHFLVNASDEDGDALAYAWDFGDGYFGPNSPSVSKSWNIPGDYVVRCTVSDMKGGLSSRQIVISVGIVATFTISGRIMTDEGVPVEGARVHNNQSGSDYRTSYTDSDGLYVLVNNLPGVHHLFAVKHGYSLGPSGWENPVALGPNAAGLNWTAAGRPRVRITATDPASSELGLNSGTFTIIRSGPTNAALAVKLSRHGTAFVPSDYTNNPAPSGVPLQIVIPAGATLLHLMIHPLADTLAEGPETVTLTLIEDAGYDFDGLAEATVTIVDEDSPVLARVEVSTSHPAGPTDNLAPESGSDSGTFVFSRDGSLTGELTILYSVTGTATPGVDYTPLVGVVTIPPGETITAVSFQTIDDAEVEDSESITVTILANPAYQGAGSSATVIIDDDDPPLVTITATDHGAREADGDPGTFAVTRHGSFAANLLVHYSVTGTAQSDVDFIPLSGSLMIPAGHTTTTITLMPHNDSLLEGEETVIVTLTSSVAYNVGRLGTATLAIEDDELPSVSVFATNGIASEAGPTASAYRFVRTGDLATSLMVYYSLGGTAAPGADYRMVPSRIVIPAELAAVTLTITPVDDAATETEETVQLVIGRHPTYTVATAIPSKIAIQDNDSGLPAVGFTFAASEGPENRTPAQIAVALSTNSPALVSVDYVVTGGSAAGNGVDYVLAAGTARIVPGTLSESISLPVLNDSLIEPRETVAIALRNPVGATFDAITTHTFTIVDDDESGTVSVSVVDEDAAEGGPDPGIFRITRGGQNTHDQTVFFEVLGGASSPSDYQPLDGSAMIVAGNGSTDIRITPVDDATDETNEAVTIHLLPTPGVKLGNDRATLFIADNDDSSTLPIVNVAAEDSLASEPGSDTGSFIISRDRDTNDALVVQFIVNGTAADGMDYVSLGQTATIPAGSFETTVFVTPRDDPLFETNETVVVTMTILETYRVGSAASAVVSLSDDEVSMSLVAADASAEDGSSAGRFTLFRSGSLDAPLHVNIAVAGTADAGEDYEALPEFVVIPASTNAVELQVIPLPDTLPEGNETVVVILVEGSDYQVATPDVATVLIVDDEPTITITANDESAYEAGGNHGAFTITRTGSAAAPLTVYFTVTGTAANGVDYALIVNSITIPAEAASIWITILPRNDDETEGNESVQITLLPDPAYAIASPLVARVTIADDEVNLVPTVSIINPASSVVFLASTNSTMLLEAAINDDGRPNPRGTLWLAWSKVSGAGIVTFNDPSSSRTTVTFSTNGVFLLRMSAHDGELEESDQISVVIGASPFLNAGLLAYWPFDESAGTTAFDGSGHGRDSTLHEAVFSTGRFSNALHLDGVSSFGNFASPPLTQLTVSAWVSSESGESLLPMVLAMPGFSVYVQRDDDQSAESLACASARSIRPGEWRTPGGLIGDGSWQHILVAYDSSTTSNSPTFYVNGVLQPSTRLKAPAGAQFDNTGAGYIGNTTQLDRSWDGQIDEMRLYNRCLNEDEIARLASGPPTNFGPIVEAGPSQIIPLSGQLTLEGSIMDDGQPDPPGEVQHTWAKRSGPGAVNFTDATDLRDTVSFSEGGVYVLRLTATDGEITTIDDVVMTVIAPTTISIGAAGDAHEFGNSNSDLAEFTLRRNGDLNSALPVRLAIGGTAINGVDYAGLAEEVTMPAGLASVTITIRPFADGLPEGEEAVTLNVMPDPAYFVESPGMAAIRLMDAPWDDWRFDNFTALQRIDPGVSGERADPDGDGKQNLYEYGIHTNPNVADTSQGLRATLLSSPELPVPLFLATYTRRRAPADVTYELELTSNLVEWNTSPFLLLEIPPAIADQNGVTETVIVWVFGTDLSPSHRFVRLKVGLPGFGLSR